MSECGIVKCKIHELSLRLFVSPVRNTGEPGTLYFFMSASLISDISKLFYLSVFS
jgi:hypothetical protein